MYVSGFITPAPEKHVTWPINYKIKTVLTFSCKSNKLMASNLCIHITESIITHCTPSIVNAYFKATIPSQELGIVNAIFQSHHTIHTIPIGCIRCYNCIQEYWKFAKKQQQQLNLLTLTYNSSVFSGSTIHSSLSTITAIEQVCLSTITFNIWKSHCCFSFWKFTIC